MTLSSPPNETRPASNTSGSVLREYISPTCKLQISANPSALEKWTRKPTLKNQRFLLSFEDPRLSEDQWVSLRGDRFKLAALTEAVTTYVQGFLGQSRTINPAELTELNELTETTLVTSPQPSQGIELHPKGLLAHTLKLGTIASNTPDDSLSLTSTQLADLASVLDEHSTTTLDLPVLNRDTAWMRSPAAWGKIAALSLLSVGITASVLNQFSPKQTPTQIASQASSSDQRLTPHQLPSTAPLPSNTLPSSTLPTTQIPSIGSSTPPIATESNPNSNPSTPAQGTSKPDAGNKSDTQSNTTGKTTTRPVESTNTEANPRPATTGKPSLTVQPVPLARQPQPLDSAKSRKSTNSNEAADSEPQPPEPDWTAQLEGIQSKVSTKWTPPEKFAEELSYIIEVAPSGVVKSVSPEGKGLPAAQAILPALGSPIAPPLPPGNTNSYQVRVFFFPDGTVNVKKG